MNKSKNRTPRTREQLEAIFKEYPKVEAMLTSPNFQGTIEGHKQVRWRKPSLIPATMRDQSEIAYLVDPKRKSGYKYVHAHGKDGCYQVYVWIDKKWTYVGAWRTPLEAAFGYHDFVSHNVTDGWHANPQLDKAESTWHVRARATTKNMIDMIITGDSPVGNTMPKKKLTVAELKKMTAKSPFASMRSQSLRSLNFPCEMPNR